MSITSGGSNVFELMAKISLDTTEYTNGLNQASSDTDSFGSGAAAALGGVAGVAASAGVAAAKAIYKFGADAVATGSEFDKAMSQVAATMGYTVADLSDDTSEAYQTFMTLRSFAMEQGATTKFTSEQAAEALNYMALAGYDAEKSMRMMPNVLALAAAGNISLAEASDMVTDAESAFGLTMEEQVVDMVNQMAVASSKTNTSVAQMGAAFLTVGATARQLKGGTAEAAQVLGLLADNGIKGSEAGTALRNMMTKLANPTEDGAAALERMGVSVFDAEGNFRDMEEIFLDLQAAMDGMNDEERSGILSDLFNRYDLAAANALLGTQAERWQEVSDALDEADGAAQNMADTQMDNLAGDLELFQSAFDNLKILLSDTLTPGLRTIVQEATEFVTYLTTEMSEGGKLKGAVDFIGTIISGVGEAITAIIDGIKSAIEWADKLGKKEVSGDDLISGHTYTNEDGNTFTYWNEGGSSGRSGKFANGISYVPKDGFIGYLHEGERVLTADENRAYSKGGGTDNINITMPILLDGKQIGQSAYNYSRRRARALG